jgi:1-acyl-sn-glycerol-3-phosphate acyltransferase
VSDLFYDIVTLIGRHVMQVASKPVVIGKENVDREGAFIVAANHCSPYDVAVLIRHSRRRIDFLSMEELFRTKKSAAFFGGMNAFSFDRANHDPSCVRVALDRLQKGRVVGIFPEGRIRNDDTSMLKGGRIRPGLARLAMRANCPIIPAAVANSTTFDHATAYLPLRRCRYGVIFGPPLEIDPDPEVTEQRWVETVCGMYAELVKQLGFTPRVWKPPKPEPRER